MFTLTKTIVLTKEEATQIANLLSSLSSMYGKHNISFNNDCLKASVLSKEMFEYLKNINK